MATARPANIGARSFDQKQKADERIEALLLKGLASGEPIEINQAFWEKKRAMLTSRRRKIRA